MRVRLRPTIAPLFDRPQVRQAGKDAVNRSGHGSGVYVVVELSEPLSVFNALRQVLRGKAEVFYVGTSCVLRTRISHLSSGLTGLPHRHETAEKILALPDLDERRDRFFLILVPTAHYDSLEQFLLKEHLRAFGHWPLANFRRGGHTSARHQPRWVTWSWPMFGIKPKRI